MCRTEILPPFKRVVQVRQLRILRCPRQNWLALGEGIPTAQSVSMPGLTEVCEVRVAAQKGPVLYTRGFPGDTGKSFDLAGREIAPPKFVFVADLPEMIAPLFNLADAKPGVATGREVLHGELLISSECKIRAFLLSREKQVYEPVTTVVFAAPSPWNLSPECSFEEQGHAPKPRPVVIRNHGGRGFSFLNLQEDSVCPCSPSPSPGSQNPPGPEWLGGASRWRG